MPKQLVTAIGLIVSLGVIALGVFLVALPLYFQAVGVDAETESVADTNALYETQVATLEAQEENLASIEANVSELRSQIPANSQLDDVFEVVARASEASGVALTAVTAGEQTIFVARTGVESAEDAAAAPAPAPSATPEPSAPAEAGTPSGGASSVGSGSPDGRQQVDFVINATAADMAQATAFLDALRGGPRLLSSITATSNLTGEGTVEVQVNALSFIDAEG